MKKNLIIASLLLLVATVSFAAKDTLRVPLGPKEHLFVELTDEFGGTVYRKYKPDCYIDLIITTEGHINAKVHFYSTEGIEDFKVAFVPGAGYPEQKDWVLKIFNPEQELIRGETEFGVMDKEKFTMLSSKFKEFSLIMVYKRNGVVDGNELMIGE